MLFSDAISRVRAGTLHDTDTQYTDTQLLAVLVAECRSLRRWLAVHVPQLCSATVSAIAVTTAAPYILKSALTTFERLIRVERLEGSYYFPISVSSDLEASKPGLISAVEQPLQLLISPADQAAGTYQVVYCTNLIASPTTATDTGLPSDLDDVMIERACAWARQRHDEGWQYHLKVAEDKMREAHTLLKTRYGSHGRPGLKREWGR